MSQSERERALHRALGECYGYLMLISTQDWTTEERAALRKLRITVGRLSAAALDTPQEPTPGQSIEEIEFENLPTECGGTFKCPLTEAEWMQERLDNCMRLAAMKRGKDRMGWLEDADYFQRVLKLLRSASEPTPAAPPDTELAIRITDYLESGGLWNPESMERDKVRSLLFDCRDALAAPRPALSPDALVKTLRDTYVWLNSQRASKFIGTHPSEVQAWIARALEESGYELLATPAPRERA